MDPEPLSLPPPMNDHQEENPGGYQEPRGFASCLQGGAQAPLSNCHFKQLSREIAVAQPSTNNPRLKWSSNKLGSDEEDHLISTRTIGMLPIVCMPTINNIAVNRTLIDGGGGSTSLIWGGCWKPPHHVRQQHPLSSLTSSRRGREGRRRTTGKKLGSAARRGGR
jgi:hypothetical protein